MRFLFLYIYIIIIMSDDGDSMKWKLNYNIIAAAVAIVFGGRCGGNGVHKKKILCTTVFPLLVCI